MVVFWFVYVFFGLLMFNAAEQTIILCLRALYRFMARGNVPNFNGTDFVQRSLKRGENEGPFYAICLLFLQSIK